MTVYSFSLLFRWMSPFLSPLASWEGSQEGKKELSVSSFGIREKRVSVTQPAELFVCSRSHSSGVLFPFPLLRRCYEIGCVYSLFTLSLMYYWLGTVHILRHATNRDVTLKKMARYSFCKELLFTRIFGNLVN